MKTVLFADYFVLLAEDKKNLQKFVSEFSMACGRRELEGNMGSSKIIAFEKKNIEVIDVAYLYRIRTVF